MTRESTRKAFNRSTDEDTNSRARALGVLELLLSAQASAEIHHIDKTCIARLEKCVERLRTTHALSQPEVDAEFVWVESSMPGLLRLLVYLQAEAADSLQDAICAMHLQKCVTQLMRAHRLSADQLCAGEGRSCH